MRTELMLRSTSDPHSGFPREALIRRGWSSMRLARSFEMSDSQKVNWDTMAEIARLGNTGMQRLLAEHKTTASPEIAGSLIGVITEARRKRWVSPTEAMEALVELSKSLDVWGMASRHIPASLLGAFESAVYEEGLPEGLDYGRLAELMQLGMRNRASPDGVFLETAVTGMCASLAARDGLGKVLATRPGAREE